MSEELNPGHWHEACDRAHCIGEMIQIMLLDHPAVESDPLISAKAQRAQDLIGQVYQEAGAKM